MSAAFVNDDREALVELARGKPTPPYTLDEQLTFFCPQENLEALSLPIVREFHEWVTSDHIPVEGDEPKILLLLPCEKEKPYSLSPEHRAVSLALAGAEFKPTDRGDWPEELKGLGSLAELSNAPLSDGRLRVDRAVISEPFGIVPYEAIYKWRGMPTPCARYDDPGLFEHRGIGAIWRSDCTSTVNSSGSYSWGDSERRAYVEVHNRLADLIRKVLERLAEEYEAILAYVGHTLTHRTFLADDAQRRDAGIPRQRRFDGRNGRLVGVNDLVPGLVELIPDAVGLDQLRAGNGGRLPASFLTSPKTLAMLNERLR